MINLINKKSISILLSLVVFIYTIMTVAKEESILFILASVLSFILFKRFIQKGGFRNVLFTVIYLFVINSLLVVLYNYSVDVQVVKSLVAGVFTGPIIFFLIREAQ